jgi:hypothetical protein
MDLHRGWVMLGAPDVLNTFTAVIGYCNKTSSLALAPDLNLRKIDSCSLPDATSVRQKARRQNAP